MDAVWHFLPSDAILTDCRIPKNLERSKKIFYWNDTRGKDQAKVFAEKQYAVFDGERKKTEALQADLENQKTIEALIEKTKKKLPNKP